MRPRISILPAALLLAILVVPSIADAQFATPNTAGANGGSCTSGYAWPDSGGHALVCSSGTWQLVNDTVWSPSGSNIYFTGGNVGIGTTAPQVILDAYQAQNAADFIDLTNLTSGTQASANIRTLNNTGNYVQMGVYSTGSSAAGLIAAGDSYVYSTTPDLDLVSGSGPIKFAAGGVSEQMRITSGGNVGIGVTNPQSLLAVNANGSFTNGPSAFVANASTTLASTLDALNYVAEFQGPALGNLNRLLLLQHRTAAGSGWQTVAWRLQPAVDASFTGVNSNVGYVELSYGTSGSYRGIGLSGAGNTAPDLVVNSSGNVGIGTTAPAANGLTINSGTPTLTFQLSGTSEESLYDDGSYFYVISTSGANGTKLQHGSTLWTSSSDRRIKKDIAALPESYGLSAVERLKPVTFHWRDPKSPQQLQMGLIAQDVQQVIPELVTQSAPTRYAPDGELGIEYSGLVIPLIKAVQELKGDNDNLRREFEAYEAAHP
jgi:Chaperone of endosialidase